MIRIDIARAVPSQNATMYRHWRAYTAERDAWFMLMRAQLVPRHPVTVPAWATILAYRGRTLDYGNLVGGAKPIPDSLKRLGYIVDDSPQWFQCVYAQLPCLPSEERTVITLSYDGPITPADAIKGEPCATKT